MSTRTLQLNFAGTSPVELSQTLFSQGDSPCPLLCVRGKTPGAFRNAGTSSRRRGERAKLAPPPPEEQESNSRQELCKSTWAACIKRIYEIDPLECPKCRTQMRIIAFIQDAHSIKDTMKSQGIPDFQAPPPIPKFINAQEAIDEIPSHDSFEPAPDDF